MAFHLGGISIVSGICPLVHASSVVSQLVMVSFPNYTWRLIPLCTWHIQYSFDIDTLYSCTCDRQGHETWQPFTILGLLKASERLLSTADGSYPRPPEKGLIHHSESKIELGSDIKHWEAVFRSTFLHILSYVLDGQWEMPRVTKVWKHQRLSWHIRTWFDTITVPP